MIYDELHIKINIDFETSVHVLKIQDKYRIEAFVNDVSQGWYMSDLPLAVIVVGLGISIKEYQDTNPHLEIIRPYIVIV